MCTFGDRFKLLRKEMDLTQEELRELFNNKYHRNFTGAAISMYENNKRIPEIDALLDFAEYFNVSLDYLLGKSDIRNPYDNKDENINNIDGDIAAHLDGKEFSEDEKKQILSFIDFINSKNKE